MVIFIFNVVEPVQDSSSVLPLGEAELAYYVGVYSVKDLFADLANLRFGWVDKATSWVVSKVWFVVFEGSEGFTLGSSIDAVI